MIGIIPASQQRSSIIEESHEAPFMRYFMAYNTRTLFEEVDKQLTANPAVHLYELARSLKCSHPTIEKAVVAHTSLPFRDYQQQKLLEKGIFLLRQGYKTREIGSLLGYRWPENFLRFVKKSIGCSLRNLNQHVSISAPSVLQRKLDTSLIGIFNK